MDSYAKERIQSPRTWQTRGAKQLQKLLPGLLLGLTADQEGTAFPDTLQGLELDSFILEIAALELKGVRAIYE